MPTDPLGTTVILIRHADRDTPTASQNPPLNAAGRTRARQLVRVLGGAGIAAIYTSDTIRSRETARPLAAQLAGVTAVQHHDAVPIRDDILLNRAGQTVLVVGHTNTVPELINLLGGGSMPDIEDREFDNLFIVTILGAGRASLTRLKYGAAT